MGVELALPAGACCSPLLYRPAGPCPDGHFYLEHSASCLPCFCFGVTSVCQSSRRFRDQIRLRFDQPGDFKGALVGRWVGRQAAGSSGLRGRADMGEQQHWTRGTRFRRDTVLLKKC